MKILVVEDNKTFGTELLKSLEIIPGVSRVDWARSRNRGAEAIASDFYDLLILDLALPLEDDEPPEAVEHGQSLFHEAQTVCPGLPIFVLTGSPTTAWGERLSRYGESIDLWGSGVPSNTVDYLKKESPDLLIEEVRRCAAEVAAVNGIRINSRGKPLSLSPGEQRAIQVIGRKLGGAAVELVALSGGLSSASVMRLRVFDSQGGQITALAVKFGRLHEISIEADAYERNVRHLPVGSFPHVVEIVQKGTCGVGAISYRLAEEYDRSLFDVLHAEPDQAAEMVGRVRANLRLWIDNSRQERWTVGRIRQRVLWDEQFTGICQAHSLDLSEFEKLEVDVRIGCIHGDLHGGNVLAGREHQPLLLDFGDVGDGPLALDPVTLELSLLFHPDGHALGLGQAVAQYLASWENIDGVPQGAIGDYIRACRSWAYDVGFGDMAVLACAYAYAIRQFKFETVPKDETEKLLSGVVEAFRRRC